MEDDTITTKDLFDTKIMGLITPMPSQGKKRSSKDSILKVLSLLRIIITNLVRILITSEGTESKRMKNGPQIPSMDRLILR